MPSIDRMNAKKPAGNKPVQQKIYDLPKKCMNSKDKKFGNKQNAVKVRVSAEHSYENVQFSKKNVTVVQVHDNKLQTAIKTFDKILNEYGTEVPKRTTLKLQKSRTCSIIESKCVMKKKSTTKSLENIASTDIYNRVTVKDAVNKFNSITDTKIKPLLPKAVSTMDISSQTPKRSKIPIKSSLNRTFPSTPTGLNIIDRKLGSTQNLGSMEQISQKKTQGLSGKTFRVHKSNSVHNLSARLGKNNLTVLKTEPKPVEIKKRPVDTKTTFGAKKSQFEPKFAEAKKMDLKKIRRFGVPIQSKQLKVCEIKMETVENKNEDYNSDDSGNISNELIADLSSLTSSSRNNSLESLPSAHGAVSKDRSIDEEKIFFRNGVLTQLETQRDERLAGVVVNLQSHCRGYLARKKLAQRKLQDLAVRCIQRNVRKFIAVRDWPWWRLLVRVTPLLNVHRTEEELKSKTEELEVLRAKVEKLESERMNLKYENDKLEAKVSYILLLF